MGAVHVPSRGCLASVGPVRFLEFRRPSAGLSSFPARSWPPSGQPCPLVLPGVRARAAGAGEAAEGRLLDHRRGPHRSTEGQKDKETH